MRNAGLAFLGLAMSAALLPWPESARAESDPGAAGKGQLVFVRYCGSCHGKSASGDGPLSKDLRVSVPDLTRLAERNKGTFPQERVQKAIENGETLRGHGSSDMPAWGDVFKHARGLDESPEAEIRNLTEYLRSIQRK
jgi:mono/diheme cytochrome c family protein